jgi:hypothetical protein
MLIKLQATSRTLQAKSQKQIQLPIADSRLPAAACRK